MTSGRLVALLVAATACTACGGGDETPAPPSEPEPRAARIEVQPSSAQLSALGATREFSATVRDQAGNAMTGVNVVWSAIPDSVTSINSDGVATAEANGRATVEAEAQGVAGTAELTVDQEVATLLVRPDSVRLTSVGDSQRFRAQASDRNGHSVTDAVPTWSSSDPAVARIESTGLAVARGPGSALIRVAAGEAADSSSVHVELSPGTLVRSFRAFESDRFPADLEVAASPTRILAVSNFKLALFDHTGSPVARTSGTSGMDQLFAPVLPPDLGGFRGARVLFDEGAERFMVLARAWDPSDEGCEPAECTAFMFLAVSTSPDVSSFEDSDWHLYALDATLDNDSATVNRAVRTRLSATDRVVLLVSTSVPMREDGGENTYSKIRILEKDPLVRGDSARWTDLAQFQRSGSDRIDHIMQPVRNLSGLESPLLVSAVGDCRYALWTLERPLENPTLSTRVVASPRYPNGRSRCRTVTEARQPGGAPGLTIGAFKTTETGQLPSAPLYHRGSIWATQNVDVRVSDDRVSGVRITRIEGVEPGASPSVAFDTIIAPTADYRFLPALTVNDVGDIGLVYGRSSADVPPAAQYGYWDGNTWTIDRALKEGKGPITGARGNVTRWGDHFGAALDPSNGSLWLIGQYAASDDIWGAWIGNLVP